MTTNVLKAVKGIQKNNSQDYVSQAFSTLNEGKTVVSLTHLDSQIPIHDLALTERIATDNDKGWYQGPRYVPSNSDDIAQIVFSSGTEGESKTICVSHAALANTVERLTKVMEIDASIREYIGVPVNFSFGFGRCRVVSAAGGEFYLPKEGFNPFEIAKMLRNGEINAISAVPTLWRLVLGNPEVVKDVGAKVKWIEIGSQYMKADEKAQMAALFPNAKIVQHYGLTEASRTTFLKIHEASAAQLESVGEALCGVEVKIGEGGAILIRGPHLATTLYRGGKAEPIADESGWFATSDKGHLRGDTLVFEGRMDDIINCGGIKLSPEKLDRQLLESLPVDDGLHTVKVPDAALGETVGIAVLEESNLKEEEIKEAATAVLVEFGINLGNKLVIESVPQFPYTDTGKLKRKALTEQLKEASQDKCATTRTATTNENLGGEALLLINVFSKVLGERFVNAQSSLRILGADSLSIVQLRMALSKYFQTIPDDWIDLSINELAKHMDADEGKTARSHFSLARLETYIVMRAAAIILVVLHHYGVAPYSGGSTKLLFAISGFLFFGANSDTIKHGRHIGRLWLGLVVLVCTLIPITAVQAVMHSYFGSDWHITLLLPYENLVNYFNDITNTVDNKHHVIWLWFIHNYLQMFGFLALILSIKKIREAFAEHLFNNLLVAFFLAEIVAIALIGSDSMRQDIMHSAALLQYAPTTNLPAVLLGGLIALAKNKTEHRQVLVAALSYLFINLTGIFTLGGLYALCGIALLIWLPAIALPKISHRLVMVIAESSLFIYLTHMPIKFALLKVSPIALPASLAAVLAIAAAVIAWPIWSNLVVSRIRMMKAFH